MIILRIIANAVIMAGEVAAVAALAAFAFYYPFVFAGVTAALSFVLGLRLEVARLRYELPFYFGGLVKRGTFLTVLVGASEALFKALLAGVAALFTFAGTNTDRLFWVAILFGLCVYAGAAVLRLLSIRAEALPMRWGYFRLAPPLGLLFSAGLTLLAVANIVPPANVTGIGWDIIFNTPAEPSIAQVSELFFQLKQAFDEFIVKALGVVLDPQWARLVGVVISVNVLSGFVSAVYAALIADAVRKAEDALL
jgi:soluble lytic murein transglycosylase-like protein